MIELLLARGGILFLELGPNIFCWLYWEVSRLYSRLGWLIDVKILHTHSLENHNFIFWHYLRLYNVKSPKSQLKLKLGEFLLHFNDECILPTKISVVDGKMDLTMVASSKMLYNNNILINIKLGRFLEMGIKETKRLTSDKLMDSIWSGETFHVLQNFIYQKL